MTRVKLIDAPLIHAGKALSNAAGTMAAAAAAALLSMPAAADTPNAQPAPATAPERNSQDKLPESDAQGEWVMVGAVAKHGRSGHADDVADAKSAPPALPAMDDDGR